MVLHDLMGRAEEALLSRTLLGLKLERDVRDAEGAIVFPAGREIDRELLDRARELSLLAEVGHAAEPSSSDNELAELLWRHRQKRPHEEE